MMRSGILATAILAPSFAAAEPTVSASPDHGSQAIVALFVVALFTLLTLERAHRVLVACGIVSLLWIVHYLTPWNTISFDDAMTAVDANVILLLAAMMTIVGVLKETNIFSWLVHRLVQQSHGETATLLAALLSITAVLSALFDNVTTVILITPIAQRLAGLRRISVWPFFMPMIMAANIGGAATLIGDPPNILIGSAARLSFLDFLLNLTVPVLVMMIAIQHYAIYRYRDELAAATRTAPATDGEPRITDPKLLRWSLYVLVIVLLGFLLQAALHVEVAVPAFIGAVAILTIQDYRYLQRRGRQPTPEERAHGILKIIEREIEWPVLAFFFALFIVMGAATQVGLTDLAAHGFAQLVRGVSAYWDLAPPTTLLFAAVAILWLSAIASMIVDNIPFTMAAIPVVAQLSRTLPGDNEVLWWALALGACLGGNGTLIGASANVTVAGMAEKLGQPIGFAAFMRFGVPVTAITLTIASAYLFSWVSLGAAWTNGTVAVLLVCIYRRTIRNRLVVLAPVAVRLMRDVQDFRKRIRNRSGHG